MNGVSARHTTARPHAYCLGTEGGPDGGACMFSREASDGVPKARVYGDAARHADETGHTVNVDATDRTTYTAAGTEAAA